MQLIKNREPKLSEKNQFLFVVCSTPTFDIEPFFCKGCKSLPTWVGKIKNRFGTIWVIIGLLRLFMLRKH